MDMFANREIVNSVTKHKLNKTFLLNLIIYSHSTKLCISNIQQVLLKIKRNDSH